MKSKTVCVFVGLVIFGLSTISVTAEEPQAIRVMSYNIRYNNPGDGINAWPNRKDHVAEMIGAKHRADFAGLQEVLKGQIDDLAERLPNYAWIGVGRDDGWQKGEFSPIFYRKEQFELLQTNTFWLAETPEIPGSKSWDTSITRVVTWGKFKDLKTDHEFYHFNTHFDHRGQKAREESAQLVWKKIKAIAGDAPTFFTGDFNTRENSKPYEILAGKDSESDLIDARYVSKTVHRGPTASTSGAEGWTKIGPNESRIDYIFIRNGISVLSHQILDDQYDGRYPSDHLPVLAEIVIAD
ncbi:MAG: endonuclease/exonuclease/phosphatase family protein [Candidatus Omnitrophota bacterium]|jgi:endonuclease/exonuclease/phosphatase family metal-dependent hydrolase|nr:MAG: endonuclease/exonuclease/phosphatase family protein [Candidatus Omnitrophota bacterium]